MDSARWEIVTRIFTAALSEPLSERRDFVRQKSNGDSEIERAVLKLLAADDRAGSFLEKPALMTLTTEPAISTLPLLSPGHIVSGRFEILRFIGQGGMGQVYEALDLELKVRVALKAIRPEIAADSQVLSRFKREVLLTRRITHPNVCRTFDIDRHTSDSGGGIDGDITFLTMELLEGETLADLLRRQGRLSTSDALPLVLQIIDALGAAHGAGIIHRDLKPSNVLLVPSQNGVRAVVTDFGLARAVVSDAQLLVDSVASTHTGAGGLMGTLVYMAPEQFERSEATVATDIYALGLVMYEMVTGERPFADIIPFAEAAKRLKEPPPPPRTFAPNLDPGWEATIYQCLQVEPGNRFENALQVGEKLANVGLHPTNRSHGPQSREARRNLSGAFLSHRDSQRVRIILTAILLLFLSLFGIGLRHYLRRTTAIRLMERDWILVTDFTNQTGEKLFDRVVQDLTVQSLSQSSYVNIVPRLSALDAARRTGLKDVDAINEQLGRELCLRENYKALLTGSVFKVGSRYVIAMKLEAPGKDTSVISDSESIQSPDALFAAVDRLTARMRLGLGESLSRIETNTKALAQVTTPSLEGLQRYSAALDLYGAREYKRCINLAKDAVERDPNFAMAHLLLARAFEQMGDESKFRAELNLASTGVDRVTEPEKHLIRAAVYSSRMMNEEAAEEYQHLLDISPDNLDALKGYAYEAFWAGHTEDAIRAQKRVLDFAPDDAASYDALMTLQVRTNRFGDALAVFEQSKLHHIRGTSLTFQAGLAKWGEGDLPGAHAMLDALGNEDSAYWKLVSRIAVGGILAFQGHMSESIGVFRTGLTLAQMPGFENWVPVFQYQIARAEIIRGNTRAARAECQRYRAIARKVPIAANLQRGVSLFLEIGDLPAAREFQKLARRQVSTSPDPFSEMELHSLTGEIDLAVGDTESAIGEGQSALTFRKWYVPYFLLGKACERRQKWDCAIEAYSRYVEFKGAILRGDVAEDWVLAHHSLARAYVGAGNMTAATAEYNEFLGLLTGADQDLPVLERARHEIAYLKNLEQHTQIHTPKE